MTQVKKVKLRDDSINEDDVMMEMENSNSPNITGHSSGPDSDETGERNKDSSKHQHTKTNIKVIQNKDIHNSTESTQEREEENDELDTHLGREKYNLRPRVKGKSSRS